MDSNLMLTCRAIERGPATELYLPDNGFALRADFDLPADYVSIDIIGDDLYDIGVLLAYNSNGDLIDSITTPQLSIHEIYTATLDHTSTFDIAYIIVGGDTTTQSTVHIDNLIANIPEPATFSLLGFSVLILRSKYFIA